MPDLHEPVGIVEGQGLEKDCVDDAEDGRVGANAEGHDENGNRCKSGALEQVSGCEFEIFEDSGHEATSATDIGWGMLPAIAPGRK
jgi:hypothetical protein